MNIFKAYSEYYDLLYIEKDYKKEAKWIHEIIQEFNPGAKTILNLGCGTGNHDFLLSEYGYEVAGVDLSPEMIEKAKSKSEKMNGFKNTFQVGDIRNLRLNRQFDAVISLFHVMSYQTTNEDLNSAFKTSATHLASNGIFLFDCWYGPGVLNDKPATRYRMLESEKIKVHRIAQPSMHPNLNRTDVNYRIMIENKINKEFYTVDEIHKMRHLFQPEIDLFAEINGLERVYASDWFGVHKELSEDDWQALFILKSKIIRS